MEVFRSICLWGFLAYSLVMAILLLMMVVSNSRLREESQFGNDCD